MERNSYDNERQRQQQPTRARSNNDEQVRFGFSRDYNDSQYDSQPSFDSQPNLRQNRLNKVLGSKNNNVNDFSSKSSGVVIYSPTTYEDIKLLIDHLKQREQVIVDFSVINQTVSHRILDFMSGAIYALDGSIQQITNNIYLFAPQGVTITMPPNLGKK